MADTATKAKVTRNRAPSPFAPKLKVTISAHAETTPDASAQSIGELFATTFGDSYSVRTVSRSRISKSGKAATGPASLMVYIAPKGYEFAKTGERGVRLDSETANLLRAVAAQMGLDPNDSASIVAVAKALAHKAQGSQS